MKIIILGAGQVGGTLAEHLASEANDITVVDTDAERLRNLGDRLDIRTVQGRASFPTVLRQAGADDADMLVAVTNSDETNMVACQVAHTLFHTPTKIARVREAAYLTRAGLFDNDAIPVDVLISPEQVQRTLNLTEDATAVLARMVPGYSESSQAMSNSGETLRGRVALRLFDGIPQGSPISPLLANLYMRRFILGWKKLGLESRFGAKIVSYADDLVICCKRGADEALSAMREIMGKVGLTVNEEKTRTCSIPDGSFDFLGYTFGRCYSTKTGRAYTGTRPSKKSVKRMIDAIHADTDRKLCWLEATEVV